MYNMIFDHWYFYQKALRGWWENVGPIDYVTLLMTVGAVGWYLMRKGPSNKC